MTAEANRHNDAVVRICEHTTCKFTRPRAPLLVHHRTFSFFRNYHKCTFSAVHRKAKIPKSLSTSTHSLERLLCLHWDSRCLHLFQNSFVQLETSRLNLPIARKWIAQQKNQAQIATESDGYKNNQGRMQQGALTHVYIRKHEHYQRAHY